jgi:hypothetical protein
VIQEGEIIGFAKVLLHKNIIFYLLLTANTAVGLIDCPESLLTLLSKLLRILLAALERDLALKTTHGARAYSQALHRPRLPKVCLGK